MRVGEVCVRETVIARADEPLLDVVGLMREYHVGSVVLVERRDAANYPTGILTDRDVVLEGVIENLERIPDLVAGDLVTRPLVTVAEADEIDAALETMRKHGVRRIPVVDERGALVGILAVTDLVDLFASRLASLVTLSARGVSNEENVRS